MYINHSGMFPAIFKYTERHYLYLYLYLWFKNVYLTLVIFVLTQNILMAAVNFPVVNVCKN